MKTTVRTKAARIKTALRDVADKEKAAFFPRFFKTGPGQYGEGDRFLGVTVPEMRLVAKRHADLPLPGIEELLESPWHEERLTGLLILVDRFEKGGRPCKKEAVDFYLARTARINNWDLVDATAYHILGAWLVEAGKGISLLRRLARSHSLWEQRIAIVATLAYIRAGNLEPTIEIAAILLDHRHDLLQKATGWMLREMGKKDAQTLRWFLGQNAEKMPRTMLRYAIERLPKTERKRWLLRKNYGQCG